MDGRTGIRKQSVFYREQHAPEGLSRGLREPSSPLERRVFKCAIYIKRRSVSVFS